MIQVQGLLVDDESRCVHYHSEKDIYLSIDFKKKVVEYSNTGNIFSIEEVVSKLNKLLKD